MRPRSHNREGWTGALRRSAVWLAVVLTLMLVVLAASPAAHEWLHGDADQADHVCAITLFAHGLAPLVVAVAVVAAVWRFLRVLASRRDIFVQAPEFAHLPGRAPPQG